RGRASAVVATLSLHDALPISEYPLGHGKAVYFWSFLVAVMLFTVGGMFSVYEGLHKLQHPEPLRQWWWAAGVLLFGICAEGVSIDRKSTRLNSSHVKISYAVF